VKGIWHLSGIICVHRVVVFSGLHVGKIFDLL